MNASQHKASSQIEVHLRQWLSLINVEVPSYDDNIFYRHLWSYSEEVSKPLIVTFSTCFRDIYA